MRPCRLSEEEKEEEDNGRKRNQFSKDERLHLLSIMRQYAPLLDDKSASVFDRREIWRAIERDFYQAGFIGKTSAQLKKYWQNYKYHGRRSQASIKKHSNAKDTMEKTSHPKVPENHNNLEITKVAKEPATSCVLPRLDTWFQNINESGCHQRDIYGNNGTFFQKLSVTPIHPIDLDSFGKNLSGSEISQSKRFSSKVCEEPKSSNVIECESEKPIGTDVIVSNTDVSNNSVTVSVICSERTPEPFSRNRRKREGDTSLDRLSFQSDISAASSSKKRKDDDQSIFPTAAGATKGRCFLLQPRQTDNHGEVISNRRNAIEAHRKLESAKEESTTLPSKFIPSKVSCSVSAKKISVTTKEDFVKEDSAADSDTRDTVRDSTYHRERRKELKIGENAASRSQRDDSDGTPNDAARLRFPNARLQDRDEAGPVQSELRDELNYRLMLHRLEVCVSPICGRIQRLQRTIMLQTEEKRLKVKIAEMAIQEIRFRIRALNEDIRRADELHELQLALATAQAVSRVESRTR